ncbi:hypothetical protein OIDMADRAFT_30886 [Oidiodendron maius Zn]|uniref:Uncharacterized protein n=1 Tax=Oidiodendron maius (strain Zn) TaxID=913774 RepID=A0A0C3GTA1_OIDMZ|nr:hypothetical protein OIDMADRAFT_30886 [Oidiodendron maius Zn]
MRFTALIVGVIFGLVGMAVAVPVETIESLEDRVNNPILLIVCLSRQMADDIPDDRIACKRPPTLYSGVHHFRWLTRRWIMEQDRFLSRQTADEALDDEYVLPQQIPDDALDDGAELNQIQSPRHTSESPAVPQVNWTRQHGSWNGTAHGLCSLPWLSRVKWRSLAKGFVHNVVVSL